MSIVQRLLMLCYGSRVTRGLLLTKTFIDMERFFIASFNENKIRSLLHTDGRWYNAVVCIRGCEPKSYKTRNGAIRKCQQLHFNKSVRVGVVTDVLGDNEYTEVYSQWC